jgi:hypothetical protein
VPSCVEGVNVQPKTTIASVSWKDNQVVAVTDTGKEVNNLTINKLDHCISMTSYDMLCLLRNLADFQNLIKGV